MKFLQIHTIHNLPPNSVNRDDTGAPKNCIFGGTLRARISSQSKKRAMRTSDIFMNEFAGDDLIADRTQRLPTMVSQRLVEMGRDAAQADIIAFALTKIGKKDDPKKKSKKNNKKIAETSQLIFVAPNEVEPIAAKLAAHYDEVGEAEYAKLNATKIETLIGSTVPRSVDVAAFGRMTTSSAFDDVHAAVQVAHLISTHSAELEQDYFTGVDDLSTTGESAMIGVSEFTSATMYGYAVIDIEKLAENLGGDNEVAHRAVIALVHTFARAMPGGKRNAFAPHTAPSFVGLEFCHAPLSYANAFATPVRTYDEQSLIEKSIEALCSHAAMMRSWVGATGPMAYSSPTRLDHEFGVHTDTLSDLLSWTSEQLREGGRG